MELSLVTASNYTPFSDMVSNKGQYSMEEKWNSCLGSIDRNKVNDKKCTPSNERNIGLDALYKLMKIINLNCSGHGGIVVGPIHYAP